MFLPGKHTTYICLLLGRPEKSVDSLEPELWKVVSHHVVTKNWIQVLYKSTYFKQLSPISLAHQEHG